jgi:phosphoheptose isomerase
MDGHAAVTDAAVVQALFDEAIALHRNVRDSVQEPVIEAAEAIRSALGAGGKLLVFGNSGSAADAQHMAAELVGRFERERDGMAAIALTADTSIGTSVANDFTFDWVFARQVDALGKAEISISRFTP